VLKKLLMSSASFIHSFIHSLVSLRGRAGRNQNPVMWPVWLWHTASWESSAYHMKNVKLRPQLYILTWTVI